MSVDVERRLLKWGNGYGLRLTKDEVARLGARAGTPVHATLDAARMMNDLDSLVMFHSRRPYDIKKIIEEDA